MGAVGPGAGLAKGGTVPGTAFTAGLEGLAPSLFAGC